MSLEVERRITNFLNRKVSTMPQAREYAEIIARNILAGKNSCGTLQNAVAANDTKFFVNASMPVIEALLDQLAQEQNLRLRISNQNERLRFALESMVQNLHQQQGSPPNIVSLQLDRFITNAVEDALARQINWP